MKMYLVKFNDKQYGVKKWSWLFFKYVYWYFPSTEIHGGWWSSISEHSDSWRTDEITARARMSMKKWRETDYGEIIK